MEQEISKEKLISDLRLVIADAEELLKARLQEELNEQIKAHEDEVKAAAPRGLNPPTAN